MISGRAVEDKPAGAPLVGGPVVHQPPPPFERVRPSVVGLDLVLDHLGPAHRAPPVPRGSGRGPRSETTQRRQRRRPQSGRRTLAAGSPPGAFRPAGRSGGDARNIRTPARGSCTRPGGRANAPRGHLSLWRAPVRQPSAVGSAAVGVRLDLDHDAAVVAWSPFVNFVHCPY